MADLRNTQYSAPARNAMVDALAALLNTGYLRIYSGAQPATADDAPGAGTLLAELRFGNPAFAAAAAGQAAANAITQDSAANATGTAAWFRALKSDGATTVLDGNVGKTGDANTNNLELGTDQIVQDAIIQVTAMTISVAAAGV
jgi:hypothetical protein